MVLDQQKFKSLTEKLRINNKKVFSIGFFQVDDNFLNGLIAFLLFRVAVFRRRIHFFFHRRLDASARPALKNNSGIIVNFIG